MQIIRSSKYSGSSGMIENGTQWSSRGIRMQPIFDYMSVATIWVKQYSIMYKTLKYSNFEAFDFNFDMVLYYIFLCDMVYKYYKSIYNVNNSMAVTGIFLLPCI